MSQNDGSVCDFIPTRNLPYFPIQINNPLVYTCKHVHDTIKIQRFSCFVYEKGFSMYVRSFLKWAGSKYNCLDDIFKQVPREGDLLIEPFVGSATVALNTNYKHNVLCDLNPDVINLYKFIVADVESVISALQEYFVPENNVKSRYYELKDKYNESIDDWERAILFVYLNRHCYNGLIRYSGKGNYNVSFGSYAKPKIPENEMRFFAKKFKNAEFRCHSFEDLKVRFRKITTVLSDPPYVPASPTASFSAYTPTGFGKKHHVMLDKMSKHWSKRNANVFVCNHDVPLVDELYPNQVNKSQFEVSRTISCKIDAREKANEVLLSYQ
jgi:DNA adenine methylase